MACQFEEYGVVMDFGGAASSSSSSTAPAEAVKTEPVKEAVPETIEEVVEQPVYKMKKLELPAGVQAIFKVTRENNSE